MLIVLLVVLLLFGAKKLPDLAKALGRSVNEFKKGRDEGKKPEGGDSKPDSKPS